MPIMKQKIDSIDSKILAKLGENARCTAIEIAQSVGLSGAAIHLRIKRLLADGIIRGWHCLVDPETIGYTTRAIVGISMSENSQFPTLLERARRMPQITEADITSGRYDLVIKIYGQSNGQLLELIQGLTYGLPCQTETLFSFEEIITRQLPIQSE